MALELLIAGGVVAVAGLVVLVRAVEKRRREALEQYCLVRGLRFQPARPDHERQLQHVHPMFDQGHSRHWGYTVSGDRPHPFTAFEYRWTTGGGKSQHTHHIAGVLWEVRDDPLPQFRVEPEGVFAKIGQVFGMQDFDFEEDRAFSGAYKLQGGDEMAVRKLFGPPVRAYLTGRKERLAGAGSLFLWWCPGRLPKADLDRFLSQADEVRRVFLG